MRNILLALLRGRLLSGGHVVPGEDASSGSKGPTVLGRPRTHYKGANYSSEKLRKHKPGFQHQF